YVRTIALTGNRGKGKVTLVDDEYYAWLSRYKWHVSSSGYARATVKQNCCGAVVHIFIHKLIARPPRGMEVDHKDLNKLNNCRGNLRVTTAAGNNRNQGLRSDNTSGFKGVSYVGGKKRNRYWAATIQVDGVQINLGYYLTP